MCVACLRAWLVLQPEFPVTWARCSDGSCVVCESVLPPGAPYAVMPNMGYVYLRVGGSVVWTVEPLEAERARALLEVHPGCTMDGCRTPSQTSPGAPTAGGSP